MKPVDKEELQIALRKAAKHIEVAQTIAVDYPAYNISDLLNEAWSRIYMVQKELNIF